MDSWNLSLHPFRIWPQPFPSDTSIRSLFVFPSSYAANSKSPPHQPIKVHERLVGRRKHFVGNLSRPLHTNRFGGICFIHLKLWYFIEMRNSVFILFLLGSLCALTFHNGLLRAEAADVVEDEVEDDVEGEETAVTEEDDDEEGAVEGDASPGASSLADTTILFTKPITSSSSLELPAGNIVELLIGFTNKGEQEFVLEAVDASFRYPMDFAFHIQNFSTIVYNKAVPPSHEATLAYTFVPSEAFAGRPFGLSVNLHYRDSLSGAVYRESVYNETVQVVEVEEGLDGETFFLYVFLAACAVLLLVAGQQLLASSVGRSGGSASRRSAAAIVGSLRGKGSSVMETGTNNPNDVDYDWVPTQMLNNLSKSPKQVKQSPRQRKAKRTAGGDD